ncbi:beta-1,3-galactosyltransferase brn-like [Mytilus californianus]|uniref:beta-1,3-galactosyltransferase brn-like n=1 Tax=Mytilus californianus TaxID=6549 RepID=UPI00224835CD|nr:beta-1,3-galactosyltransferase brn-like [Mytilus californianus]XP_052088181.1 beta-1,3-galactosyltransferase brn-like [Mytilus californianus]
MEMRRLNIRKLSRLVIGLICGIFLLQVIPFKDFTINTNLIIDVPALEKVVFEMQSNVSSNGTPLNKFDETYIYKINPADSMCNNSNCDFLQMILIVKSYVLNFGQREAIRRTWGGTTKLRSKILFIVGYLDGIDTLVEHESTHNRDIIQLNMPDQYEYEVYKMIYSILWLFRVNLKAEFVFFVNDDRLVNPKNIYSVATNNIYSTDSLMLGYRLSFSKACRDNSSKRYISTEDYPFVFFPPYIIGGTILTNIKTIKILAIAAAFIKVIPLEDAYIGIVAKAANIKLKHHSGFLPFKESLYVLRKAVSSPGYEATYMLLQDWSLINIA